MLENSVSLYLEDSDNERPGKIEDEVSNIAPGAALSTTRRGRVKCKCAGLLSDIMSDDLSSYFTFYPPGH